MSNSTGRLNHVPKLPGLPPNRSRLHRYAVLGGDGLADKPIPAVPISASCPDCRQSRPGGRAFELYRYRSAPRWRGNAGKPVPKRRETRPEGNVSRPEGRITRPAGTEGAPRGNEIGAVSIGWRPERARPVSRTVPIRSRWGAPSCVWPAAVRETLLPPHSGNPAQSAARRSTAGVAHVVLGALRSGSLYEGVPDMSAFVRRVLAKAALILGITATAAWISLLGYELVALVVAL
jgi:hypothetical protein